MALRNRAPGLICLLLMTAAAILLAGRPSSAAPVSGPEDQTPPQNLEEGTLQYGEASPVQLISLSDLEPAQTDPEQVLGEAWTGLQPVGTSETAEVLAELNLNDGTCIRLCAAAEGLVYGAFLRPGGQWTRFVRLDGAAVSRDLTLTSFSGILGKEGFLLRRADGGGEAVYDYFWFGGFGDLQVLRAQGDPTALDLDGDGAAELAWGFAGRQSAVLCCPDADGVIRRVTPDPYMDGSRTLLAVEREGPGPARLIYRCGTEGRETFCAVTLEEDRLRIERDIVYVPAEVEAISLPADPTADGTVPVRLSVTGPGGQWAEDAGDAAARTFWSMLWAGDGAVLVPTDAPLDEAAAYTVTFTPEAGEALSWTLDDQGVCRITGLEGTCRMLSTGLGALPEWCRDTMALCCDAARTAGGT